MCLESFGAWHQVKGRSETFAPEVICKGMIDLQRFAPWQAWPFISGGRRCSSYCFAADATRKNMESMESSFS